MSHLAWENWKVSSCMRKRETLILHENWKDPQRSLKTPQDPQSPPKTSREALEMSSKLCLTNRSRSCNGLPLCFWLHNVKFEFPKFSFSWFHRPIKDCHFLRLLTEMCWAIKDNWIKGLTCYLFKVWLFWKKSYYF